MLLVKNPYRILISPPVTAPLHQHLTRQIFRLDIRRIKSETAHPFLGKRRLVMPINQAFLGEFDHEMANTRKTLERVPLEKFDWVPHEKSMKMGALANHLTDMPGWIKGTLENDSIDVANFVPEQIG